MALTDRNPSAAYPSRLARILLVLWMAVVLLLYWILQGSPGIPAFAEIAEPLREIIQKFFSAPYLG